MISQKHRHQDPRLEEEFRTLYDLLNQALPSVGTIKPWFFDGGVASSNENDTPAGWFLCSGKLLAVVNYPDLFNLLGFRYGYSADRMQFQLPTLTALDTYNGWIIKGI